MPNLYLIPTLLDENGERHISPIVVSTIETLKHFVVERTRTSRRFIRKMSKTYNIDEATFIEMDKHDLENSMKAAVKMLNTNVDVGLMSEAGAPCLADPGAKVVGHARRLNYTIKPLSGPSSIMLAIMASGLNGQEFTFHGYLPVKDSALRAKLDQISAAVRKSGYSQLWIETPYRNEKMLSAIARNLDGNLKLSIAVNLNGDEEIIDTKMIKEWKGHVLGKVPAIFMVGK